MDAMAELGIPTAQIFVDKLSGKDFNRPLRDVNAEIIALAKDGYTHFFVDEASYLGGFLNVPRK